MSFEILGYTTPMAARPGEVVRLHFSCEGTSRRYFADVVRIICGDTTLAGPGFKEEVIAGLLGVHVEGRRQDLHVGSFGLVDAPAEVFDRCTDFTVGCRFLATLPGNDSVQVLIGRFDPKTGRGWKIGLDERGRLFAVVGGEKLVTRHAIPKSRWFSVTLTYDGTTSTARLHLDPVHDVPGPNASVLLEGRLGDPVASGLPIVLAAEGADLDALKSGSAVFHFNGKIEAPYVLARALSRVEVQIQNVKGLPDPVSQDVLAAWDLSRGIDGSDIIDIGLNSCHGLLINLPTRGVTSSLFDGTQHSWVPDPSHHAAVHFHDDDFEDARWQADLEIRLPDNLKSGVYAARLTPDSGGVPEHIVFFVAAPRNSGRSPIAYLASTCTYMAYSNMHSAFDMADMEAKRGLWMTLGATEAFLNERRDLGLSPYDTHSDGSGVCYSSRLRPLFSLRIGERVWALNADTHLTDWLEHKNFDYDVITDDHLHAEGPSVLAPYRVVVTGTHPEYWSTRMLDSLEQWQGAGGRLMYMGGNGFYWRTAFHPDKPWLIEIRRAESGARYWETEPGESYHSFSGEYGGLWRRLGRAPQKVTGIGTIATGFDFSSYFRRTAAADDPRAAFIFEGVDDEIIGDFGSIGGGAAGEEIDAADPHLGTPPHALVVASSEAHTRYMLLVPEAMTSSISNHSGEENPRVKADIVFYEGQSGGAVFSVGSISWGASLAHNNYDNNVSRITENVLRRFADPQPFVAPPPGDLD